MEFDNLEKKNREFEKFWTKNFEKHVIFNNFNIFSSKNSI